MNLHEVASPHAAFLAWIQHYWEQDGYEWRLVGTDHIQWRKPDNRQFRDWQEPDTVRFWIACNPDWQTRPGARAYKP